MSEEKKIIDLKNKSKISHSFMRLLDIQNLVEEALKAVDNDKNVREQLKTVLKFVNDELSRIQWNLNQEARSSQASMPYQEAIQFMHQSTVKDKLGEILNRVEDTKETLYQMYDAASDCIDCDTLFLLALLIHMRIEIRLLLSVNAPSHRHDEAQPLSDDNAQGVSDHLGSDNDPLDWDSDVESQSARR